MILKIPEELALTLNYKLQHHLFPQLLISLFPSTSKIG